MKKASILLFSLILVVILLGYCTKPKDYSSLKSTDFNVQIPTTWRSTTNITDINNYINSQKLNILKSSNPNINDNLLYLATNGSNSPIFPAILIYTFPKGNFTDVNNVAKYNSDIWQNTYGQSYKILSYNFPSDNSGIFECEANFISRMGR